MRMFLFFPAIIMMTGIAGCGDCPDLGLVGNLEVAFYRWNGDGKEINEITVDPDDPLDLEVIVSNDGDSTRANFLQDLRN